ncbi:uncharacterized protein LOC106756046 isoform X2 [Vigna radiata var. radiata]|uniref:Uncharacterized protein LOC106756046 isoform X2 n=1 Tax=Vigna radiata var. radiata TaxID=3916 RepID=A0A1S3TJ43_VIGRR|nr:uncharacterized protein LOC106756046 isoform X2 [Vigna radiata var. radiata]
MQTMRLMLSNSDNRSLIRLSSYLYSYFRTPLSFLSSASSRASSTATNLFTYPWSSSQRRGIKIRVGNIIGKQGRIYEVLKVDHSHEGRGKATIKVELRDIGQGNKITQRMNTDDNIERVKRWYWTMALQLKYRFTLYLVMP